MFRGSIIFNSLILILTIIQDLIHIIVVFQFKNLIYISFLYKIKVNSGCLHLIEDFKIKSPFNDMVTYKFATFTEDFKGRLLKQQGDRSILWSKQLSISLATTTFSSYIRKNMGIDNMKSFSNFQEMYSEILWENL